MLDQQLTRLFEFLYLMVMHEDANDDTDFEPFEHASTHSNTNTAEKPAPSSDLKSRNELDSDKGRRNEGNTVPKSECSSSLYDECPVSTRSKNTLNSRDVPRRTEQYPGSLNSGNREIDTFDDTDNKENRNASRSVLALLPKCQAVGEDKDTPTLSASLTFRRCQTGATWKGATKTPRGVTKETPSNAAITSIHPDMHDSLEHAKHDPVAIMIPEINDLSKIGRAHV